MAPALFLVGIGQIARWRHATMITLAKRLRWALAVSVVAALAAPWLLGTWTPLISFGLFLALWIFSSAAVNLAGRLRSHPAPTLWARVRGQPGGYYGMLLAHCGMGVFVIGVTLVGGYEREQDVVMQRDDTVEMAGYTFRLDGVVSHRGPIYVADTATITVARAGATGALLPARQSAA